MNSLLVFDYETTGLDPVRDRPVQFACIRTDLDLNAAGAPATFTCKPAADHLPDPGAALVTGVTPQLCEDIGLPELRFVDAVHRALSVPGTIAFGYNSIAFDDEITRFMLWRNLIDPYAREWQDGCGRWDLLPLVRATYALRPDTLVWPRGADGAVSFALAALCAANGVKHPAAHDALSDVAATLGLARLLRERQPQLYAHCFSMLDKARALQEMAPEADTGADAKARPFLHVDAGPAATAGIRLLLPIAAHPTNRNEVIAWDLAHDPDQLFDIDAEVVRRRLFTRPEDQPEGFQAMPIHCIAANRSPAVFRDLSVLTVERAAALGIDVAAALDNAAAMADTLSAVDLPRLLQVVFAREAAGRDADDALYEGFVGNADRRMLDALRGLDASGLAAAEPEFVDPRLNVLFLRYKARHFPASLSSREQDKWEEHRYDKLIAGVDGSRTVSMVRAAVAAERQVPGDALRDALLDDVLAWTNGVAAAIDPFDTGAVPVVPAVPGVPAVAPAPIEAPTPPTPVMVPVQPDLFGGEDVTPGKRRGRSGRS